MSQSKHRRKPGREAEGLNLAPFMNIVAILIPMLLLSVVFLKVGVIDVSSPSIDPPVKANTEKNRELDLTVGIARRGFEIATADRTFAPVDGCPDDGPTICLANPDVEIARTIDRARQELRAGNPALAEAKFAEVVEAYDYATLYAKLEALKEKHPGQKSFRLTASPEMPYKLLIRVMDAVRFELDSDGKRYADNAAFWRAAAESRRGSGREPLFSEPILAVGR